MKKPLAWLLFVLGFAANLLMVKAPVHELGHLLAAWFSGREAGFTSWAVSWWRGGLSFGIVYGGYAFELFVWVALAAQKWRVWPFFMGSAVAAFLEAFVSSDFHTLGPRLWRSDFGVYFMLVVWAAVGLLLIRAAWVPHVSRSHRPET